MASSVARKRTKLLVGVLLVAVGLGIALIPMRGRISGDLWAFFLSSMMWLWPLFFVCMGVIRVMGFAVQRKPRSPMGGTLLIFIGVLFFASRFHSDLNALRIYGKYWLVLLAIFAAVELLRFYSHRHSEGPTPRMFSPGRLCIVGLIVITGILANRVGGSSSLLSALKLPTFLSGIRDSVVGQAYNFVDSPITVDEIAPGMHITINNRFGDVKVVTGSMLRATLSKGVRAWNEQDARQVADQIKLVVARTPGGITISTNRDNLNQQFTTNIQIEVPPAVLLEISDSYGTVSAGGTNGPLAIKVSYGQVQVSNIVGDLNLDLAYSDVIAADVQGDLVASGAKNAKLSRISGSVDLSSKNGSVDLLDLSGQVQIDAPFGKIVAKGLREAATLRTQHASVQVSRSADLTIDAPNSDVRVDNVSGDLKVSSSNSEVQLRSVTGEVSVSGERSSVSAEEVRGRVEIETSHGSVAVKNFYEGVNVRTSYRNVNLVAAVPISDDVEVENDHGEIRLVLAESSQFLLDAASESGQVRTIGFSGMSQRNRDSLLASFGAGAPTIKLRTSFKNITVQAGGSRQAVAAGGAN